MVQVSFRFSLCILTLPHYLCSNIYTINRVEQKKLIPVHFPEL